MSLNSFKFIVFFALLLILLAVFQLLRKKNSIFIKTQLIILLVFSYFFILETDWRFCLCIVGVTVVTFFSAVLSEKRNKRGWIIAGIIILILILIYFKYANFFVNSFRSILLKDTISLNIILPAVVFTMPV